MFRLIDTFVLVCLDAQDSVLIERATGKRIDPKTKGFILCFHSLEIFRGFTFRNLSYHLEYSQFT